MGFLDPIQGLSKPHQHTGERYVCLVQLHMLIFHLSTIIDIAKCKLAVDGSKQLKIFQ